MSDSAKSSRVEDLEQLSSEYESRRARSAYLVFLAGASAALAVIAVGVGLYFAWSYYQGAINTVKESTLIARTAESSVEDLTKQLQAVNHQVTAEISDLKANVESANHQINELKSRVDSLSKALQAVNNQAAAERAGLKADMESANHQINELRSDLQKLREGFAQMNNNLLSWGTTAQLVPPLEPTGANGPLSCEKGYYVVGLNLARTNGVLNGLQLNCRPINSGAK